MIVNKVTEITVFESPDGGKTVYRRSGNGPRTRVPYSPDIEAEVKKKDLQDKWMEILEESEGNPALQEAVDRCIMLYDLTRTPKETVAHHPV